MNRIVKNLFIGSGFYRSLTLLCVFFITACSGGALVFDGGNEVHIEINENTAGSVWTSKAQLVGQSEIKSIVYELAGADAALFSINSATGVSSFKIPADFEQPLDADKNNEYKITVEAKINGKSSGQQVYLQIKNVTQPVVELVKPKPNENVGTGETVEVETLVRFYDAESNTPVPEGRITLNSIPMEPSSEDAQIWKSKTSVPEEGVNLSISAFTSLAASVDIEEKLLNKRNSANVNYVWAVQGDWMLVAGGELDILTSFNFATKEMIEAGTGLYYPQELP
ncbi:MAG: cadherin repeat domain-containing protein, partial [Moraxellaceae bacterium]